MKLRKFAFGVLLFIGCTTQSAKYSYTIFNWDFISSHRWPNKIAFISKYPRDEDLTNIMQEIFSTAGYRVVEENQIKKIMVEYKLNSHEIEEKENLNLIGKLANIDALIICSGGYFDAQATLKMLDIQTGSVVYFSNYSPSPGIWWQNSRIARDIIRSYNEALRKKPQYINLFD